MNSVCDGTSLIKKIRMAVDSETEILLCAGCIDKNKAVNILKDVEELFVSDVSRDELIKRLSVFMDVYPELFDALVVLDIDD